MVTLLMKERCQMPTGERMTEVLAKHLGEIEQFGDGEHINCFAAKEHIARFEDGNVPVQLMIANCDESHTDKIGYIERSQFWDCPDSEQLLAECKYQILATDVMGGALPAIERANMLMDYLEALVELFPECEAVYNLNSGKLIPADLIRENKMQGTDRFIRYAVNARFFNIQGTEDSVVDTRGLSLLYIEDIQYHFHDMDPNWVVEHAYNMASYLLENDRPIKDGDTIDGIVDGRFSRDLQWQCRFESSLIEPKRVVINVNMGEYAAGDQ